MLPGRLIGKTVDNKGMDCKTVIMSTREQHIRREKATSNICSNQAYVATLCAASLLSKGEQGLEESLRKIRVNIQYFLENILSLEGIDLAYPNAYFF